MTVDFSLTRDDDYSTDYPVLPIAEEDIKQVEVASGLSFPDSYREFLMKYNGGSFMECIFHGGEIGPLVVVSFFSVMAADGPSLDAAIRNMSDYLPPSCIPFADDPGGNVFYIDLDSGGHVFFWEHETRRTYSLSEDFGRFVASLALDE